MTSAPHLNPATHNLIHPNLPVPNTQAQQHSQQLMHLIQQKIAQAGGWIDFATFMHMALYTPSLGYYSGGALKFGEAGDFVTAPEISPLFAHTLARQISQVLAKTNGDVLELGAGTGKLAIDLLLALQKIQTLPNQYYILEVSDYLRQIQLENCQRVLSADLFKRIIWLEALPESFDGLILGNEVLDAIAAHLIVKSNDVWLARGIGIDAALNNGLDDELNNGLAWQDKPLQDALLKLEPLCLNQLYLEQISGEINAQSLPNGYLTEVCPASAGLINSLAACLNQGVILMIDYGFGAAEYYHPQRNTGTLMCHYQHYAHSNPLIYVGLQDITAHVNFTAIAHAGVTQGLSLAGYCNQASFLMNCGLLDILSETSPSDMAAYVPLAAAAQKLLSPAEMGELFKVIAFSKDFDSALIGFKSGDKAHLL